MPYKTIESLTNAKIKEVGRLSKSKERGKQGLTVIEGERAIELALRADYKIRSIFFTGEEPGIMASLKSPDVEVFQVAEAVYSKIAYGDQTTGVMATCEVQSKELCDLELAEDDLYLVLESVEKPGNLGAILRTADATGVNAVIVTEAQTDVYNPNVIRNSMGAVFTVNVITSTNENVLKFLKENNIKSCAAIVGSDKDYTQEDLRGAMALILGSEQKGLSAFWQENSDVKVNIPMQGEVDSLNVSTSAAIICYESIRQRQ